MQFLLPQQGIVPPVDNGLAFARRVCRDAPDYASFLLKALEYVQDIRIPLAVMARKQIETEDHDGTRAEMARAFWTQLLRRDATRLPLNFDHDNKPLFKALADAGAFGDRGRLAAALEEAFTGREHSVVAGLHGVKRKPTCFPLMLDIMQHLSLQLAEPAIVALAPQQAAGRPPRPLGRVTYKCVRTDRPAKWVDVIRNTRARNALRVMLRVKAEQEAHEEAQAAAAAAKKGKKKGGQPTPEDPDAGLALPPGQVFSDDDDEQPAAAGLPQWHEYLPRLRYVQIEEERKQPDDGSDRRVQVHLHIDQWGASIGERLGELQQAPPKAEGRSKQDKKAAKKSQARRRVVKRLVRALAHLHARGIGHHRVSLDALRFPAPGDTVDTLNGSSGKKFPLLLTDFAAARVYPQEDLDRMEEAAEDQSHANAQLLVPMEGVLPDSITCRSFEEDAGPGRIPRHKSSLLRGADGRPWGLPPPELHLFGHIQGGSYEGEPDTLTFHAEMGPLTDMWDAGMAIARLYNFEDPAQGRGWEEISTQQQPMAAMSDAAVSGVDAGVLTATKVAMAMEKDVIHPWLLRQADRFGLSKTTGFIIMLKGMLRVLPQMRFTAQFVLDLKIMSHDKMKQWSSGYEGRRARVGGEATEVGQRHATRSATDDLDRVRQLLRVCPPALCHQVYVDHQELVAENFALRKKLRDVADSVREAVALLPDVQRL